MRKILMVRPGSVYPEVRSRYGDFDTWFVRVSGFEEESFDVYDPTLGETSPQAPESYRGVIVTGSHSAAYCGEPWIGETERLIRRCADRGAPLFGVCFGAQIVATALGGRVIRNPRGKELGTVYIELTQEGREHPLFRSLPAVFPAQASHDDCVDRLPDGARLLATNDMARVQGYSVGSSIHAVQFHPEILPEMMRGMLQYLANSGELDPEKAVRLESQVEPSPDALGLLDRFFADTGPASSGAG